MPVSFRHALVVVASVSLLAACKAELSTTVYLGDVAELAASPGKSVGVPAQLSIQMISKQACVEKGGEALQLLTAYFAKVGNGQCRQAGFDSFMDVPIEMPVFSSASDNATPPNGSVVGILAYKDDKGQVALIASVARDRLAKLQAAAQNKYMQKVDLDQVKITVAISNDGRKPATVSVGSGWVNGQPQPWMGAYNLDRRGAIEMRLSDVAAGSLMRSGLHAFAWLPPAE